MRDSTMPNRESALHNRRHDELIDRSRGDRALPPLLHIANNRLQVPGQDVHDSRNPPMTRPRSRSRSPIGMTVPSTHHHEYLNRSEETHTDAPLDLSAASRASPSAKPGTPLSRPSESRDQIARDTKIPPLGPLGPYAYPAGKTLMLEQALKAAQMTPAQLALYQQEWLKHYRWPGFPLLPESIAAAQLTAASHLLPPSLDPRALTSPTDPRMTSSSTSPRPTGEAEERERDYQMRLHSRMYREHSPNPSTSPRDHPPRDPHSPPSLPIPTPAGMAASPQSTLQVPGAGAAPMMHSPHNRQSSPVNRDPSKERLSNRSVGPNLLGDFPPEDVLFLRCNLCIDTCGNVHSFIKHFTRDHASEGEPRPHHVTIESISRAKHAIETNHIPRQMEPRPVDPRQLDPLSVDVHYAGMMARSPRDLWGSKELPKGGPRPNSPSVMRCPKCPQEFSTRDWGIYKRHMKSHENSGKSHETSAHETNARSREISTTHAQQVRQQQTLVCDECHVSFHDNLEWQLHMSISHSNRTCVCRICNVGFGHIDAMYKHVYTAHNGLNAVEVEFNCLSCSKAFTNERSLIEHMKSKECGIDRNSIGSMISLSVKSRVRDQAVSMSPPLKRHRMTPDTTCSEDKPVSTDTVPVTTIANSVAPTSVHQGSNITNMMEQSTGKRYNEFTVIDLIQQKVEQEHRRQSSDVTSRESPKPPEVERKPSLDSRQLSNSSSGSANTDDRFMSPLKRRLLGYDKIDMDTTPIKQMKLDTSSVGDRTSRSPSGVPKLNAQSIISNIVESTVLGCPTDFDSMYKRSIAKMITEENEREKREEGVVKQDADSSFGKEDSQNVTDDKKYQHSLKGVLNTLVENEAKKVLGGHPVKSEIKEESKFFHKDSRFEDKFTPNIDKIIRSELEKSDELDSKESVKNAHNAHVKVTQDSKQEESGVKMHSYKTEPKDFKSMNSDDSKSPKDSQSENYPKPSPQSSTADTPSDSVHASRSNSVESNGTKADSSLCTNVPKVPHHLNPTQNVNTEHSDTKQSESGPESTENSRHSDATGSEKAAHIMDRLDSYEEGKLVICEDQTD